MEKKKKYITLEEGIDYRTISKIMSSAGFQMNHATARNVFLTAMSNFLNKLGKTYSDSDLEILMKNEEFHESMEDILFLAHEKYKESLNKNV